MSLEWVLLSPSINFSVPPVLPDQTQSKPSVSRSKVKPFPQVAPRQRRAHGCWNGWRHWKVILCSQWREIVGCSYCSDDPWRNVRVRIYPEGVGLHCKATSSCILEEDSFPLLHSAHLSLFPWSVAFPPFPHLQDTWGGFKSSPKLSSDAATSSPRSRATDPDLSDPDTSGPGRWNLQTLRSPELIERSQMLKEHLEGERSLRWGSRTQLPSLPPHTPAISPASLSVKSSLAWSSSTLWQE